MECCVSGGGGEEWEKGTRWVPEDTRRKDLCLVLMRISWVGA